ncbi:tetratricopeptide repeat protein [Dokdonella sp.]|uniref:tetratricopeptide repeat protein n=1 Tax=Dokdonella sp. TaxID=2291710 RepID=UPI003528F561
MMGQRRLGFLLSESEAEDRRGEGVRWLLQAAESGDDVASNGLGIAYENGIGVEVDYGSGQGVVSEGRGRRKRTPSSILGHLNQSGIGQDPDPVMARTYFERASAMGLNPAKCHLGEMLIEGEGGGVDQLAGR